MSNCIILYKDKELVSTVDRETAAKGQPEPRTPEEIRQRREVELAGALRRVGFQDPQRVINSFRLGDGDYIHSLASQSTENLTHLRSAYVAALDSGIITRPMDDAFLSSLAKKDEAIWRSFDGARTWQDVGMQPPSGFGITKDTVTRVGELQRAAIAKWRKFISNTTEGVSASVHRFMRECIGETEAMKREVYDAVQDMNRKLGLNKNPMTDEMAVAITATRDPRVLHDFEGAQLQKINELKAEITSDPVKNAAVKRAWDLVENRSKQFLREGMTSKVFEDIIKGNMGKYIARSYEMFGSGRKKWLRDMGKEDTKAHDAYVAAAREFGTQADGSVNWTAGQNEVERFLRPYRATGKAARELMGNNGDRDINQFLSNPLQRSPVAQSRTVQTQLMRNLLGEVTNPVERIFNTVLRQQEALSMFRMKQKIADWLINGDMAHNSGTYVDASGVARRMGVDVDGRVRARIEALDDNWKAELKGKMDTHAAANGGVQPAGNMRRAIEERARLSSETHGLTYGEQVRREADRLQESSFTIQNKYMPRSLAESQAAATVYNRFKKEIYDGIEAELKLARMGDPEMQKRWGDGNYVIYGKDRLTAQPDRSIAGSRINDPLDGLLVRPDALPFVSEFQKMVPKVQNIFQRMTRLANANSIVFSLTNPLRNGLTSWQAMVSSGNISRLIGTPGGRNAFKIATEIVALRNVAGLETNIERIVSDNPSLRWLKKEVDSHNARIDTKVALIKAEVENMRRLGSDKAQIESRMRDLDAWESDRWKGSLRDLVNLAYKDGVLSRGVLSGVAGDPVSEMISIWNGGQVKAERRLAQLSMGSDNPIDAATRAVAQNKNIAQVAGDTGVAAFKKTVNTARKAFASTDDLPKLANWIMERQKADELFERIASNNDKLVQMYDLMYPRRVAEATRGLEQAPIGGQKLVTDARKALMQRSEQGRAILRGEAGTPAQREALIAAMSHERAYQRFHALNFDYGRAVPFVRLAQKLPAVAAFTSFTSEAGRTYFNAWHWALRDIREGMILGDNALVRQGVAGVAGVAALTFLFPALQEHSIRANNMTPEDVRGYRRLMPTFDRQFDVYWNRSKDGVVSYSPIGNLNLYGIITQPMMRFATRLLKGQVQDDPTDTVWDAAKTSLQNIAVPFYKLQPETQAITEAVSGVKGTGAPLYAADDNPAQKFVKGLWHVAVPMARPGAVRDIYRTAQFVNGTLDRDGNPVPSPWTKVGALRVLNPGAQLDYLATTNMRTMRDIESEFKTMANNKSGQFDVSDLLKSYDDINRRRQNYFYDTGLAARSAISAGADEDDVRETLREKQFTKPEIDALLNGDYIPYVPSPTLIKNAQNAGYDVDMSDFKDISEGYDTR